LDLGDARVREALLERPPQHHILVQQLRVVAIRIPARAPGLVEPEPEPERVNLLAHRCSFTIGALPRTPAPRSPGPLRPAPLRRRRAVRASAAGSAPNPGSSLNAVRAPPPTALAVAFAPARAEGSRSRGPLRPAPLRRRRAARASAAGSAPNPGSS